MSTSISSGGVSPTNSANDPVCPQCKRRMGVKLVASILFATGLDDVTYGCTSCGTEFKRTVKRA